MQAMQADAALQPGQNIPSSSSSSKPPSALNKILTAITEGHDSPKEGLIRAFRKQGSEDDGNSTTSTLSPVTSSSYSSERSAGLSMDAGALVAAAAAPPTSGLLIHPSDPIQLNAYRMLTVSPTLPQSMQRTQWTSYDYHILEKLYTGYASKVYKAVCKRSNEIVVLKSYQLSSICELYQHQIFREVGLHASLAHENVVQLSAAFQEGDFVVLVQEYAAGGNLLELLQKYGGRLNEHVTVQLVLEPFLRVLQYLHTRGIIHRDIKPENILFSSGMTLKLADFGLAIDLRRERAVTRAGTLDYMAPEVLNCPYKNKPEENKEKAHLHYSGTVDSWAVGVLAYELLVGCPPFYDSSRDRVEARIRSSTPTFPRTMSDNARSFITAALTKDPAKRPSVLQLLHHPWINTYRARRSMRQIPVNAATGASSQQQQQQQVRQMPVSPSAAAAAAVAAAGAAAAMAAAGGVSSSSSRYGPTSHSYANTAYAAKAKSALAAGNLAAAANFAKAPAAPGNPAAAAASGSNSPTAADNAPTTPLSPSSRLLLKGQLQGASSYAASPINKEKVLKNAAAVAAAAAGSSIAAQAYTSNASNSSSNSSASGSRSARAYSSSQLQQLLQLQQQALQQQQQQQQVQHMDVDRREQLPLAPVTPHIQQQQQQGNAASYGSSNPGTSSSVASKDVPVSDSPVAAASPRCRGSLISPRTDSTASPFKLAASTNLKTPRDPIAALKGLPSGAAGRLYGPGAGSQLKSDETLRPLIMQSAKSSPLMVSDVKQLQLEPGYGVQLGGEDETAVRQRKKWLLGSLKLFNQCTSPDTTEDDEL